MTYISAWSPKPGIVVYHGDDGKDWVREDGTRSWRNNNPGNIIKGSFAESCGAIGGDTRFAIFPDEQTGLDAVVALLKSQSYRDLTLEAAIKRYAPASDNNDTSAYVAAVSKAIGASSNKVIGSFSDAELNGLAGAIKVHEGWKLGQEHPYAPAPLHAFSTVLDLSTADKQEAVAPKPLGYIYEQATGRLYFDYGDALDYVATGYAGADGSSRNNPNAQCDEDVGPLPRGRYLIGPPVKGPSPFSLKLKPLDESVMCGRSGFYIHGDSIAAPGRGSHGCIILSRAEREHIAGSGLFNLTVVDRVR